MDQETIVYGVIKGVATNDTGFQLKTRRVNSQALMDLAEFDTFPYLTSSMFSIPDEDLKQSVYHTQVIHFAASYQAVEYHWEDWMAKFEALLKKMYWFSAKVHMETELSGNHTFIWESPSDYHAPSDELTVRCEWEQELAFHMNTQSMR